MSSTARSSAVISILSLPHELLLNCLARVSRLYHPNLSLVSKKFRSVVASPELYKTRSLLHRTESFIYLCLRYYYPDDPNTYWFALRQKPNQTLTDGSSGNRFVPIPSPHLHPEDPRSIVAVGSYIYKIGGGYEPSSSRVSVLDCRFNTWHSAPRMRVKRSKPSASVVDGKIYIAGGCEDPSSVNWVEVFEPRTGTWGNVTNPSTETRPGVSGVSFGIEGKFYLIGDYNAPTRPRLMGHPHPLSRSVGPIPSNGRSLISEGSKSLFTDPAITTRLFPVLWPHSHAIANHFPIGHPSFHYSSSSTLNSGVLSGCVPENDDVEVVVYDPKEGSWSPIGLDADLACAGCFFSGVVGDVMFLWIDGDFSWYDSMVRSWKRLYGDRVLPDVGGHCKMVDLDGKMAVLWESYGDGDGGVEETFIWCAAITLERRDKDDVVLTPHVSCFFSGDVLSATV